MKLLAFLLLASLIMIGCASSEKDDNGKKSIENLVTLQPLGKKAAKEANIYIDSVSVVQQEGSKALLISGNFPDGCTHLRQASHTLQNQSVQLSLLAWRDPEMMCAQALTPFSYIYNKLAEQEVEALTSVAVNGTTYELE